MILIGSRTEISRRRSSSDRLTTVDVTICELGTNAVRPASVRTTVFRSVISSTSP